MFLQLSESFIFVDSHVEALQEICREAVIQKSPAVEENAESPYSEILARLCLNECSGEGVCIEGIEIETFCLII